MKQDTVHKIKGNLETVKGGMNQNVVFKMTLKKYEGGKMRRNPRNQRKQIKEKLWRGKKSSLIEARA